MLLNVKKKKRELKPIFVISLRVLKFWSDLRLSSLIMLVLLENVANH